MPLPPESRRRLGRALFAIFVLALVMGPGPGILLINPDPLDPEARRFLFGMPIVYAWAAFWLTVQAACIVAAWRWIWSANGGDDEDAEDSGTSSSGPMGAHGKEGESA
jgi:hypothetical protein